MARKIFLVAAVLLLGASCVFAQTKARTVASSPAVKVAPAVSQPVSKPVAPMSQAEPARAGTEEMTMSAEGEVSLDFRDADIQNVLKILSYKSGVNIVAGPEVTGLVTLKLNNVPWKHALDVILQTYGYAYEQRGNVIVVTTVDNMKKRREDAVTLAEQELLQTRTFILNYAKASDVIASIEKMRTERGSINYDERTNTVIVRDTAANLDLIEQVIKKLDAVTPQVLIEAKIVETNLNTEKDLGIAWNVQATANGIKRPSSFPFEDRDSMKFLPDPVAAATSTTFTYGYLDFNAFQTVLKMIESRTDTNVLSNPRIVTLDNQTAKIEVGKDRPIPNYTYNEERGTFQVDGFTWRTIGVVFTVTPHVNSAGFVTLDMSPEVSSADPANDITFDTIRLPVVDKKTAKTRVMVRDGDTLVIGGMITDTVTKVKKKVPFLGDIPLLGLAFRSTEDTVAKTDLLIFLTPRIITVDTPSKK